MATSMIHEAIQLVLGHPLLSAALLFLLFSAWYLLYPLVASPLRGVPGPASYALSKWRLAVDDYRGTRTPAIDALHACYGPAVRVGPDEVSFSSLEALRTIYGAGSGFERTSFYRMFDVYGRQNLFTFAGVRQHAQRKKLLAHAYSKTAILSNEGGHAKPLIERNVGHFLALLRDGGDVEIFATLHWFSLDSITGFLYGELPASKNEGGGATHALRDNPADRALLDDILDPHRRVLSWFVVHLRGFTRWLYSLQGFPERVVARLGLLPMQKPTTYTGIRAHALRAWEAYARYQTEASAAEKALPEVTADQSIMGRLFLSQKGLLDGLDIASEAADHFLAGIDTTSDTLMFAIWALSLPAHAHMQDRLRAEVDALPASSCDRSAAPGVPAAEIADTLPYLNAVLKETLRLYAPLPASEPRSSPVDTTIHGLRIPAGTVVSMSPYTLHRNPDVFPDPLRFLPERWLASDNADGKYGDLAEMKKWFWAFSSGGRMCIGLHLAMAEMTTLMTALYRQYTTSLPEKQVGITPGITSRFEVFGDETFARMKEHECWVRFNKR